MRLFPFAARSRCGTVPGMSKLATTDPNELRPLLHERIDHCSPVELEAVRQTLLKFEAERLIAEVGAEFAEDWRTGRITEEKTAEAIREHRARHPYR